MVMTIDNCWPHAFLVRRNGVYFFLQALSSFGFSVSLLLPLVSLLSIIDSLFLTLLRPPHAPPFLVLPLSHPQPWLMVALPIEVEVIVVIPPAPIPSPLQKTQWRPTRPTPHLSSGLLHIILVTLMMTLLAWDRALKIIFCLRKVISFLLCKTTF
jgi:hypothetical protein